METCAIQESTRQTHSLCTASAVLRFQRDCARCHAYPCVSTAGDLPGSAHVLRLHVCDHDLPACCRRDHGLAASFNCALLLDCHGQQPCQDRGWLASHDLVRVGPCTHRVRDCIPGTSL
ncbi:hypothetical protein BC940DRAFT_302794 [Gongronella butleri]|nr:hypothetical protein BC940DRAFT_302794 [Gongronella butleri]